MVYDYAKKNKIFRNSAKSLRYKTKIWLINWTIKFNKFWSVQGTIRRIRRQATDWENIFKNYISDKRLLPIIIKNAQKSQWKINNTFFLMKKGVYGWQILH